MTKSKKTVRTGTTAPTMQSAYREMLEPSMMGLSVAMASALVVLFTVLGPLGTQDTLGPIPRVLYWGLCGVLCVPICYSQGVVALYVVRNRPPLQVALAFAATGMFMAAPCTAITFTTYRLFHSGYPVDVGLGEIYRVDATVLLGASGLFFYLLRQRAKRSVAGATQGTAAVPAASRPEGRAGPFAPVDAVAAGAPPAHGTADRNAEQPAADPGAASGGADVGDQPEAKEETAQAPGTQPLPAHRDAAGPGTRLLDRLLLDPGADVIYLKADGRYLQAYTTTGSSRVLMRFSDAVAALGDLGVQVHRSYWVAHREVLELVKRDTHTLLLVTGGREIPVSRTYLNAVRATVRADRS